MFKRLRHWRENRRIEKMGFTAQQWESAVADWPVMQRYQGAEREALRIMTFRFLARKSFVSGAGFQFSDAMALKIATMACVPILHLGLDWYSRWRTVILYEGGFVPKRAYRSNDGVVHAKGPALSGEAWFRGPVILSWEAVSQSGAYAAQGKASNVVIHEVAHKLDMLRDGANGAPPMHPNMRPGEWHTIFSNAWQRLQADYQHNRPLPLNEYGLTSPAEFFAVCSETFFEAPTTMQEQMPEVYRLLCQFYRQQP
ncbi:zinc-dependent peptidase [Denitrificimonas caeni]|uniref:Zinc-dependent peptidase n=1 Tax=Denitrificimonas caeni TaxID=521720 RepID=A0AAE9VMK4_9GAMM|nr:M90 family metallopeptidase [Denitrificimonas caeni]NLJ13213.1 zinc-dependent peptidase [Gammaproteobacteria bacterium]WBE24107.1 zinc-dependent peptidase [Denitrificimonas caeni]